MFVADGVRRVQLLSRGRQSSADCGRSLSLARACARTSDSGSGKVVSLGRRKNEVMRMFLDFYHLHQQPFGVTPDPAYLYPSRTHCEALDSLTEGILGGRGFLALIAEPGMGKTTLLYQVLEGLRDRARAAYLFQTQCSSREFFQYLLSELGVDSTGMGLVTMHKKLNEMLFAEMLAGRRFVLIVDEAQNLDNSVLETVRLLRTSRPPTPNCCKSFWPGSRNSRRNCGRSSWRNCYSALRW